MKRDKCFTGNKDEEVDGSPEMEKEVDLIKCTEKDQHNRQTLDTSLTALTQIAEFISNSERDEPIRLKNTLLNRTIEIDTTTALVFQGMADGSASELFHDGQEQILEEVLQEHEAQYQDE